MRAFNGLLSVLSVSTAFYSLVAAANEHAIGKRGPGRRHRSVNALEYDLHKRFDSARYSTYDVTTGEVACGGFYQPSDFVVALNSAQFDGGSHCGKVITMSWQGKTTQATIVDECPGCPYAGLDLTVGLFDFFAGSTDAGYLYDGSWDYGSAPSPTPTPTPTPTSTPPPPPPPTTSHTPTTTSTPPPPPTTSSKPHTSSSLPPTTSSTPSTSTTPTSTSQSSTSSAPPTSSSTPSTSSSSSTSSSIAPSPTPTPQGAIIQLFLSYGQLAAVNAVAPNAQ